MVRNVPVLPDAVPLAVNTRLAVNVRTITKLAAQRLNLGTAKSPLVRLMRSRLAASA
jgi:hypothetical protein